MINCASSVHEGKKIINHVIGRRDCILHSGNDVVTHCSHCAENDSSSLQHCSTFECFSKASGNILLWKLV